MKVYAISDLHISTDGEKPMDIFGESWEGYLEKIIEDWKSKVTDDDIVLICGDHSWAMKFENAYLDLSCLFPLKGKKILIRGNHDYWWQKIGKIRESFPADFYFLQNDSVKLGNLVFVGSRGWTVPGSPDFVDSDMVIYKREVERFKLAFKSVEKLIEEGDKVIALIHFPPFNIRKERNLFTELFEDNGVKKVVYGHLHGKDCKAVNVLNINGVEYILSSCDKVGNKLVEVYSDEEI